MKAATQLREMAKLLVRPAVWIFAGNLMAAGLAAQCSNPTQVPNQTDSTGTYNYSGAALSASSVIVNGSASMTLMATNCIQLLPGFHATAGTAATTFHAWVDGLPTAVSVSPSTGSGISQTFTWTASSPSGYSNLADLYALINSSVSGANACYIHYNRASNLLSLADNTGANWSSGFTPGSSGSASNSQCTISGSGSSFSDSGTQLGVTVSVTFQTSFSGAKNNYLIAYDNEGFNSAWYELGTWTVGTAGGFTPIRVSPAGPYTDSLGQLWSADAGWVLQTLGTYTTTASILGTPDPTLYQTERVNYPGTLAYFFVVPVGNYTVTLKFAEIYDTAPGQRYMNIALNGTTVVSGLDVWTAAGGANRAYDLSFPVSATNGQLTISLTCTSPNNSAEVNAIQIVAGTPQQSYLTTAVSPSGGGTIIPASGWFNNGTLVTLLATPFTGYQFSGWTGVDSSNGTTGYVTVNSNRSVTANFTATPTNYTLITTVSPSGGGTVSPSCPSGCPYSSGTQITLTATPASGYQFNGWAGVDSSNGSTAYVTMNGNRSITATFASIVTQYQLTTGVSPAAAGSTSPSCPSGCSVSSPVTITALPNAGYAFTSFSGSQSTSSNPASFTMTSAIGETANFTTQLPAVTAINPTSGPAGTPVTISGAGFGAAQGGSTVTFAGTPAVVTSWSQTGTNIVAQVPAGATTGVVTVAISGFAPASSTAQFVPATNGISTLSLTQGPPQVGFVISGNGFPASPSVTLNGTPLSVIAGQVGGCSSPSATCVAVQVPQGMAQGGPWPVVVNGVPSNGATFTVKPPFGCGF